MRYELKDFQEAAARELLDNMSYLMDGYVGHGHLGACCLAAPTGSGKTVIAAAVIEALMEGSAEMSSPADEDACILWVTDLPSLAEQTKERLLDATDLDPSRIESITNTFTRNHDRLEAQHIYFLHRQLLGKNKLLTKGGEARTFWQVLQDTIAAGTRLYLFLDEAHRGLGSEAKRIQGDETIYAQLIDGFDGQTPIPVVVGISATPERFQKAMKGRSDRMSSPAVRVSPKDVQASGLLKDEIVLMSPKQRSAAQELYLGEACKALDASAKLWGTWCAANGVADMRPLMVVQVEDKVSDAKLQELAREIQEKLPWLEKDAFAHVFGDHQDKNLRGFYVPYLSPEAVERHREVRVLFAKEAVSTGWDCPRAEVIYSMRKHSDVTYIAQLLGRMVRTPLARRVEEFDVLNAVRCFLPLFDEDAVEKVKTRLTSEDVDDWSGVSEDSGRKVITNAVEAYWDTSLGVDEAFERIRKKVESHHPTNEIEAAYEYASLLAQYEISTGEPKALEKELVKELQSGIAIYKQEFAEALEGVSKIVSTELHVQYLMPEGETRETRIQDADVFAVTNARQRADHVLTPALTNAFFRSERAAHKSDLETNARIAAAASAEAIVKAVKFKAARQLDWYTKAYAEAVRGLAEPARAAFESALSRNGIHRTVHLRKLANELQDGDLDAYVHHVVCEPETGRAYLNLNETEKAVVARELRRCRAFWRNPSSGTGEHVLSVIYQNPKGGHYTMHPDFIFFEDTDAGVKPSIIDPHGEQYVDAVPKMRGLCAYAREFGADFERIWSVDGAAKRYVDLQDRAVWTYLDREAPASADEVFDAVGKKY